MGKIDVWECSDGYITKSHTIYKRREKVLKKIDKYHKKCEEDPDSVGYLEGTFLHWELEKAERTPEQIKADNEKELIRQWRNIPKNQCPNCDGKGHTVETDSGYGTDRYYNEECVPCKGTGLSKKAYKEWDDEPWKKLKKKKKVF